MPLPPYSYNGPLDCSVVPDKSQLKGKSVIVTGGANGLGEGYVRAFSAAGAFVTFGDVNEARGKELVAELGPEAVYFTKCDTRNWDEQVQMFNDAVTKSPNRSCDIIIANAGIGRGDGDPLCKLDDPNSDPVKPNLNIIDINLVGVIYTFKLAVHYFRRQPESPDRDRCFIFKGSIMGIMDSLYSWQYTSSKFGLRGLMRTVRRSSCDQGIRVNYVAPYYVKSSIRSIELEKHLESKGIEFGLPEDCTAAMMRLACDKTINGHSLAIVGRSIAKEGFVDAEQDDWTRGEYWADLQQTVINVFGVEWK